MTPHTARAADDFATIRQRMTALRLQRDGKCAIREGRWSADCWCYKAGPDGNSLPCRHRSTMAYRHRVRERCGGPVARGRSRGCCREFGQHRMPRRFVIIASLLFLCTGAVAHPPEAEFADWFRSLKEPGTGGG